MPRDIRRQANKSALERQQGQGKRRPAVSVRSPALEAMEQQQAEQRAEARGQRPGAVRRPQRASRRVMRYAAEEASPIAPRKKSLPPMVSRAEQMRRASRASTAKDSRGAQQIRTGLTVGRRLRSLWAPEE